MFAIQTRSTLLGTSLVKLAPGQLDEKLRQKVAEQLSVRETKTHPSEVTLFSQEDRGGSGQSFFRAHSRSQSQMNSPDQIPEDVAFKVISTYRQMNQPQFVGNNLDLTG